MKEKFELLKKNYPLVLGVVAIVLLGIGTGWFLSPKGQGGNSGLSSSISVGENEAGILDESAFKGDVAEGMLKEEGINGEGTHHLEREGGKSQDVYIASTAIYFHAFFRNKI